MLGCFLGNLCQVHGMPKEIYCFANSSFNLWLRDCATLVITTLFLKDSLRKFRYLYEISHMSDIIISHEWHNIIHECPSKSVNPPYFFGVKTHRERSDTIPLLKYFPFSVKMIRLRLRNIFCTGNREDYLGSVGQENNNLKFVGRHIYK